MPMRIFSGIKPVLEVLKQSKYAKGSAFYVGDELPDELKEFKSAFKRTDFQFFDKFIKAKNLNHQNVAIEVNIPDYSMNDLNKEDSVLILDQITDEQNLGNILRSAAFFGIQAVIYPKNRSAHISPVVDRISAGGSLYVKTINVANLTAAVQTLKERGFWIVATSEYGTEDAKTILKKTHHPWGIIIGSEGKGVSQKLLEHADFQVKISTPSSFTTLNAATAAAVLSSFLL